MLIKAKSPIFVLLPFVLLSCVSFCLSYEVPYPKTDLDRCIERCRRTEEEFSGLLECANRCEKKYGQREFGGRGRSEAETEAGEASKDPKSPRWEIERCQRRCETEERGSRELQQCKQRCEEEMIKEREREQERGRERGREREEEEYGQEREDPRRELEKCRELCEKQEPRQQPQCERRCERQFEERQREERERRRGRGNSQSREYEEQQRDNPYFFHSQRLQSRFSTQNGHFKVLERFSKNSELLRGIEKYRLAILEANPNTFIVPHHCDSDTVFYVLNGKGTITLVTQQKRESFNLERGDVIRLQAGTTAYLINQDDNEKFRAAMLVQPIFAPGKFREFFTGGGENPESYYTVFSNDILETALATPRAELDRLFGQQKQGVILKAPKEKLKALSQHASSSSKHKGSHESRGPVNLLNEKPLYSNKFGKFFEVSPNDYKQLQDLDISVGFADIKQGSLMVPHYNSRTTYVILVAEGSGRLEMACPHQVSHRQEPQRGRREHGEETEEETERRGHQHYKKITVQLSQGDVFIIPAGHPLALLASQNDNLKTIGFGINAQNSERHFLAGRDNLMNQIEKEAKELSFNAPAELVEKIFTNQKESYFVAGPQQSQRREEGRGLSFESVLDLPGLF